MELTEGQKTALIKLEQFNCSEDKVFLLEGKAGTGKTFIINEFLKTINKRRNICLSAPTHKALQVLKAKFAETSAHTIQKLLGLRPDTELHNYNPASPAFAPIGVQLMQDFSLIIIDEASMINNLLFDEIVSYNTKIIFVGDASQLPPVKSDEKSKCFDIKNKAVLSEIVRTNVDVILKISQEVREGNFNIKNYPELCISESELVENYSDYKVLAYTNARVAYWNGLIKQKVNPSDKYMSVGDKVMFYNNVKKLRQGSLTGKEFINGEEAVITLINTTSGAMRIGNDDIGICTNYELYKKKYYEFVTSAKKETNVKERRRIWSSFYHWKAKNNIVYNMSYNGTIIKKDFDLAYAMTIHKSQGSTYDNVAIDINDLSGKDIQELLYVAVTRPRFNLKFIC